MRRYMKKSKLTYWMFLLPILIPFFSALILPAIVGIGYSFTDWNGMKSTMDFIGFFNYIKLFSDSQFLYSLGFSVLVAITAVIIMNLLGFSFAFLVTRGFKGSNFLRGVFFMPNLIGGVLLGFTWQFIFTKVFAAIGKALGAEWLMGWLSNTTTGFWGLVIMLAWQSSGYVMLIYIAQLQSIPLELSEAAYIDGATKRQVLTRIILPLMRPAFTTSLFISLSFSLKIYDFNLALTNGNPQRTTEMIAMNIFKEAYSYNQMGYAQAKAVIFLLVIAAVTLTQLRIFKKREIEL